jgi:hypothetical protein
MVNVLLYAITHCIIMFDIPLYNVLKFGQFITANFVCIIKISVECIECLLFLDSNKLNLAYDTSNSLIFLPSSSQTEFSSNSKLSTLVRTSMKCGS